MQKLLHASCVEFHKKGILLLGPSGSGKSELALRLISLGARLVADDCVLFDATTLQAVCPDNLCGKMEMRGVGIVPMPHKNKTKIHLCVALCPRAQVERFPLTADTFEGVPLLHLSGHDVAATADKIAFICQNKNIRAFLQAAQSSSPVVHKKNCSLSKL
ncbi:MAG: HPr kinase/phosphatase C-terminal domain-containing protein [Alphaproteobacteria bacterium]|nr:HPr kinase/phosphatase C-terminal domain-containing protein [Alphaproteobacteria bacterium]